MKKGLILNIVFILLLLIVPCVLGATIHGKVFTYTLSSAKNSIVSINTVPEQVVVSTDGKYSFNVPVGDYTIIAFLKDDFSIITHLIEDNISIVDNGDYVKDLILFPVEELDELDLEEDIIDDLSDEKDDVMPVGTRLLISLGLLIVLGIIVWLAVKEKGKIRDLVGVNTDEPDEIVDLLGFIQKHKRVTQKDIRREFPLSEAKISLMISDLESQGRIKKIKKGRGNIILFVK